MLILEVLGHRDILWAEVVRGNETGALDDKPGHRSEPPHVRTNTAIA
jgi:hypothetical protein